MTAEQKVKKVEPMAMFYNGRIWAGPMPISRRYSRSLAAGGEVMGYTKQQLAVIEADKNYWEELADVLGWKLHGFTDRNTAGFYTGRNGVYIGSTLTLTGSERDTILSAIRKVAH